MKSPIIATAEDDLRFVPEAMGKDMIIMPGFGASGAILRWVETIYPSGNTLLHRSSMRTTRNSSQHLCQISVSTLAESDRESQVGYRVEMPAKDPATE